MSTVLALRVNRDQAVLVADESTWHLGHVFGYRRTNYGDGLLPLSAPGAACTAAYCGVGFPSMHDEAARAARARLAEAPPADNAGVARVAHEAFLGAHHRLVDDKLRFDYGFSLAELNARRYTHEGEAREIQQGAVVAAARQTAAGGGATNAITRIFSNQALVVSHDPAHGVQGWYLEPKGCHMGFTTPLAVIGDGDGVASHLMAGYLERRHVGRRRQGFELAEGLFLALRIATEVHRRVGTMGGYLQVMLLDGEAGLTERASDACRLASEVMDAHLWGFLPRGDAQELVAALLLEGVADAKVEAELFERVGAERPRLERYLCGFKPAETPLAAAVDPAPAVPREAARRGKGTSPTRKKRGRK